MRMFFLATKSTGDGRFKNWLEGLNDWNLSRSRFWGTPIPIWRTECGKETLCVGSVEELFNECVKSVNWVYEKNPLEAFQLAICLKKIIAASIYTSMSSIILFYAQILGKKCLESLI